MALGFAAEPNIVPAVFPVWKQSDVNSRLNIVAFVCAAD
jgi:hypothetical protein